MSLISLANGNPVPRGNKSDEMKSCWSGRCDSCSRVCHFDLFGCYLLPSGSLPRIGQDQSTLHNLTVVPQA